MLVVTRTHLGWIAAASAVGVWTVGCSGNPETGIVADSGVDVSTIDAPISRDTGHTKDVTSHDDGPKGPDGSRDTGIDQHVVSDVTTDTSDVSTMDVRTDTTPTDATTDVTSDAKEDGTPDGSKPDTGVDGGHDGGGPPPLCSPSCPDGNPCGAANECASGVCTDGTCAPPMCAPNCPGGSPCGSPNDCGSGTCTNDVCAPQTISVSERTLAFGSAGGTVGFVACGTTPATQTFTITNGGTSSLTWWTVFGLGAASPYKLSQTCTQAAPCTIGGAAQVTVIVTAPSVPANAGIKTYDDTVTVFSSAAGDTGHVIQLDESSYGAILSFTPTDENFGSQPDTGTYTQAIQISNQGNAPVQGAPLTLTAATSTEFTISATAVNVPLAGATFDAFFTPNGSTTAVSGAIAISAGGNPMCAPLPNDVTLEGQGTQAVISVTSALNFNSGTNGNSGVGVSCGTTGPSLDAIVTNTGTQAANITALTLALGGSSPYTVPQASQLPITVNPGVANAVSIKIVPNAIPANDAPALNLNDTLTIQTNATGDNPHSVALTETTAGAALSLVPSTVAFNPTVVGEQSSYQMTLSNNGNISAPVTFTSSETVFTFDTNVVATANSTVNPDAYFTPTAAVMSTGASKMTVKAGVPLCSCPGAASSSCLTTVDFAETGTGSTGNDYGVTPAQIAFGNNTCGFDGAVGTPPTAVTVNIANDSVTATTWTAVLSGAEDTFFTVSAGSGPIAADTGSPGTASFTVNAVALGSASGLTAAEVQNGVTATLTVTVGTGGGAEVFTIPVSETPYGAFAEWSVAQVNPGGGQSSSFSLKNVSTDVIDFNLAVGNGMYAVTPTSGSSSFAAPLNASVKNDYVFMTPATSITATLTTPASSPLCGPLPGPLTVN